MKVYALILGSFAVIAMGCATQEPAPENAPESSQSTKTFRIGFSMATVKEERWQRDHDAFATRCKELGVECPITVADNSSSRQANDVDNLLTQGIDVLVIAPQDATQAAAMVDRAKAQGVPVISYDRLINSPNLDLYISHQVPIIGSKMAEYALEKRPTGNYVMVYGASTDNNAHIMKKAQLQVLKPALDRGDVRIVAEQFINDWKKELAQNFAENALTQNNDQVDAFIVSNDGMAGGVIQALAARGLSGKVIVTGQDAQVDALQNIAEGRQSMTVYKAIVPLANAAVDAAVRLAKKETLQTTPFRNDANNSDVPSILLEVISVDKNNLLDTVIKDGYAKFEEVYRNVPEADRPRRSR